MEFKEFKEKYEHNPVTEYPNQVIAEPLVSVCVMTYNQVSCIKECLDGILMQKTDFPIEMLLGEDASTDGTREICMEYAQKYPEKIRLLLHHRENNIKINNTPSGRFNFLFNLYSARAKYIALCEGDDFWTDPLKLQKQVDFLEKNEEYGALFSDYNLLNIKTGKLILNTNKLKKKTIPIGHVAGELIVSNPYTTCTVMFRSKLSKTYCCKIYPQMPIFRIGDLPLWLYIAHFNKIGYIPDATATYRRNEVSASHFKTINEFISYGKSNYKMKLFLSEYFNIPFDKPAYKKVFRKKIIKFIWNSGLYKECLMLFVNNIINKFK